MVYLQAAALGLIQGLSEFVPVSSSAHLVIVPWLFGWRNPALMSLSFDVALHLGTLLALLLFFAKDWARLIRAWILSVIELRIGEDMDRRMAWFIVIGSVPGGIAGLLFEEALDSAYHTDPIASSAMILMACAIAAMGLLLLLADNLSRKNRELGEMKLLDAVLIGLSQALAIFPGVSRSGATITGGLALGFDRAQAARYSFLLSAPLVAAAGGMSVLDSVRAYSSGSLSRGDLSLFTVGFCVSAATGFLCIKYLLKFLQSHSMKAFALYRWALAAILAAAVLLKG
jgi:undecaprenyl-diphosphatase